MTENQNGKPTVSEINHRAYEIYLQRGGQQGSDVSDWLNAEQELSNKPVGTAPKTKATLTN
jgi:hypothetical protein